MQQISLLEFEARLRASRSLLNAYITSSILELGHVRASADLVEEIYAQARAAALGGCARYDDIYGLAGFVAWMRAIARHKCVDYLRIESQTVRVGRSALESVATDDTSNDVVNRVALEQIIMRAKLTNNQRLLIEMSRRGYTRCEIAIELSTTRHNVDVIYSRALVSLRRAASVP